MFTQIGTGACNIVFNTSFCSQTYGAPVGFAILTGTAIIGFDIIQRLYHSVEVASKPILNRVVEKQPDWQGVKDISAFKSREVVSSLAEQLRELFSKNRFEPCQEIATLIRGKGSQLLEQVILNIIHEKLEHRSDILLLDALFDHICKHNKYSITQDSSNIDKLIASIEGEEGLANNPLYPELVTVLTKYKKYPPFYIALVEHGPKELGDVEFCKKLENSPDITQSLKLATPLQIRSALIYFSSKESSFHQSDVFKEFMIPIIESARERKIDLDCTDGIWTILSLVCQRIPNDSCTEGQRSVVAALLKEDRNPFERAEGKAPHLIPTMNLEILKLFISHPASSLEPYEREGFLEECLQYYPNIYHYYMGDDGKIHSAGC